MQALTKSKGFPWQGQLRVNGLPANDARVTRRLAG